MPPGVEEEEWPCCVWVGVKDKTVTPWHTTSSSSLLLLMYQDEGLCSTFVLTPQGRLAVKWMLTVFFSRYISIRKRVHIVDWNLRNRVYLLLRLHLLERASLCVCVCLCVYGPRQDTCDDDGCDGCACHPRRRRRRRRRRRVQAFTRCPSKPKIRTHTSPSPARTPTRRKGSSGMHTYKASKQEQFWYH